MTAAGKNLAAIDAAIRQHNANCGQPILAILMSPFEVERLGWDDYNGIPIKPDESLGTGRFRLVCEGNHVGPVAEEAKQGLFVDTPAPPVQIPVEVPAPEREPVIA